MLWICSFFFFKQKTAYEMRISDWSSDVCSSDLIADSRRRQRLDRPRRDRVDADILAPQIDREILDRGVERRFGDPHHIIMRHHFFRPVIGQRQQADTLWHPFARRSEAHTYELPSLMCMSNADFCL